jgi:N-acetylglucosamine kinase-like BadF-type ATPase
MGELVLGVDGGNTKTVALAATPGGAIVGSGRGGCADIYGATTMAAALAEIGKAVRAALPAGASGDDVTHASFSLAGADWPEDKDELRRALSPLVPRADVVVVNDAIGALRAGTPDGVGVAVVLGTGGCVGSGGRDGRQWHSSWWGLNLGAWWIGGEALQAVYAAELGTRPPTALTEAALALYGDATVEDLLHAFHRRGGRHAWEASRFAPDVLHLALAGDAAAREVVVGHGVKLGEIAHAAVERVGLEAPFPLALLGGVFRGAGSNLIVEEIVARVPGGVAVRSVREPAVGALLLSLDRSGVGYDLATVDASVPGDDLFHTHPRT